MARTIMRRSIPVGARAAVPAHPGIPPVAAPARELPLGPGRTVEAVLLLNLMEERLRTLWRQHRWYQRHPGWIHESEMENRAELRFVLRFLRRARMDAMRVPDEVTQWKGTVNR